MRRTQPEEEVEKRRLSDNKIIKSAERQRSKGMEQIQRLVSHSVSLEWCEQCRVKPRDKFIRDCLGLYPEHNGNQEREIQLGMCYKDLHSWPRLKYSFETHRRGIQSVGYG